MLVISLVLCFVFFVLFVFVLCLADSASGLVLRFSLTFIQSPSIDLFVLLIKLEYHNVFHHTSYIYTYKVNPIVLQRMRAIIDILQGCQVLTDGLSNV
jgi:hypothetical protein